MKTKEVVITEFFNLTKVMNELTKGAVRIAGNSDPRSGGVYIPVGTSTKPAQVWVKLSCKPDDKELIGQALTFFDRDIMDSIFSLYHDGEEDVTPAMVVRSYSGDFKKTSSKGYQKKVEDTMDKLTCLTLRIECAEQLELMGMSTRNNCVFEGPLLPLKKKVSAEMEGHEKIVYHICGTSVLYQYALKLKHIAGVTADLMNISGKRTSQEDTMIARYLLRRISTMKNKRNCVNNKRIVYERRSDEGMFGVLGFGEKTSKNWKAKKSKLHKTVVLYLKHFKEMGYISGYVVLKKKNSNYGVEIEV